MPKMSDMSQILRDRIRPCSLEVDSGPLVRAQLRSLRELIASLPFASLLFERDE